MFIQMISTFDWRADRRMQYLGSSVTIKATLVMRPRRFDYVPFILPSMSYLDARGQA
jgi:hypothetical protein